MNILLEAVYMNPSCRDGMSARLKSETKRHLAGKTCLRVNSVRVVRNVKFMLYWTNFRLKNYFISKINLRNKTLLRKISISTS